MQKYVMLDFDGVLNSLEWALLPENKGTDAMIKKLDKRAVAHLNRLIAETGAKIVISSSWRKIKKFIWLKEFLFNHGLEAEVVDETPIRFSHVRRGFEIQEWMNENEVAPEQIVILDDESDMEHLMHRLVQTSWEKGLQAEHVDRAIALLNGSLKN